MKKISYQEITNCSIKDIKKFALAIALKKNDYYFIKKLNVATSSFQMKRLLLEDEEMSDYFLRQSIKYIKNCESIAEMEQILVYMNLILPNTLESFIDFKSELYWWIVNSIDNAFTYKHYAIIRHLKTMNRKQRKLLIEAMWQLLGRDHSIYHECCLEIYLVEGDYENAYDHIPYVKIGNDFSEYKEELKFYDKKQYYKYIDSNKKNAHKFSTLIERIMLTCF